MIVCPECGRGCSDRAPQCPQCGYPLAQLGPRASVARATPPPLPVGGSLSQGTHPPPPPFPTLPEKRKSVWQTNVGLPTLIVILLGAGGYYLYQRGQRSQNAHNNSPMSTRDYLPTKTRPASALIPNDNSAAAAGQKIVDDFRSLPDGKAIIFRLPAGHYRIRVTSSNNGIKARWVGVSCYASSAEQKIYDTTCDPTAEAQFIVENPTTLGLGPSEQVATSIITR
jgi:hypothetical protein